MAWTEAYLHAKCHLDLSRCLATIDIRRKIGAPPPFCGGELDSHLTQSRLGRCLPSGILIHPAIWPQQIWAENWGLCPFEGRGGGFTPNTMWPGRGLSACQVSSGSVQPFGHSARTSQTDRQTDNGPIAYGEPFYKRSPKNCQRQSCSAINCLSSGINILAGGSSVPLMSERKGTDPHWTHLRCTHFAS